MAEFLEKERESSDEEFTENECMGTCYVWTWAGSRFGPGQT